MKRILLVCCAFLFSLPAQSQSWTDHVVSGMYGPPSFPVGWTKGGTTPYGKHDALIPGMPTHWDWSQGARGGTSNSLAPPNAVGLNAVVGHVSGSLDYKIETRNMEIWFLDASGWVRAYTTQGRDFDQIYGSYWRVTDFGHDAGIIEEKSATGTLLVKPRAGMFMHYYARTRQMVPATYKAVHLRAQYRLVGPAAATAKVVGRVGGDSYKDPTTANPVVGPSLFIARHKFIGPEWQWYTASSQTEAQIRANPPPAPANWPASAPPPPLPPPPPPPTCTDAAKAEVQGLLLQAAAKLESMACP